MSDRKTTLDAPAVTILLLCCVLWGLNQVAAKLALPEMPPLAQAGLRSLGGALLVFGWAGLRGVGLFARDGSLPGGLLAGTLFAAEFACIFVGLQFTSASRMVVFLYLSPFVVALGMPFIARAERLSPTQYFGLAAAFAGVAWAFAESFSHPTAAGATQWIGDGLGVAAALLWGGTTLAIRGSRLAAAPPEKTLLYQLALSGLLLAAASALSGERLLLSWSALTGLSALALGSLAFQTIVISFVSYLAWFWLVRHYPATRLASFTLLTPVSGLLAGALVLGEPITPRLLVALAAVAGGITIVNRS